MNLEEFEGLPLLPHGHVREKYYVQGDGNIIACSSKAGCTSVKRSTPGGIQMRIPIEEAAKRRNKVEIKLYIRHPLERLVSAWKYFTSPARRMSCEYAEEKDRELLNYSPDFVAWVETAMKYNDEHWTSQYHYHKLGDLFVPTVVVPLESMGGEITNATSHGPWRDYFTNRMLTDLNDRYREDRRLYYGSFSSGTAD